MSAFVLYLLKGLSIKISAGSITPQILGKHPNILQLYYICIPDSFVNIKICITLYLMWLLFSSGTVGARLSVDASNIRRLVGDSLALMVRSTVTVLAGFIIAIVSNWRLALIATVVLPLGGLQGFLQIKFLDGFSSDAKVIYQLWSHLAN